MGFLIEFLGIFELTIVVVSGRGVLMSLPPVPLASKPKPKVKSFAQAVKANVS